MESEPRQIGSRGCTARCRDGSSCGNITVTGKSVCRLHGGRSLSGLASPSLKTGRYSKVLPVRLAARYQEAINDPELLHLTDEIGALDSRIDESMKGLTTGEAGALWTALRKVHDDLVSARLRGDTADMAIALTDIGTLIETGFSDLQIWSEIIALFDQRRKLVESERKRLVEMQQMLTAEQAMVFLAAVIGVVRKHVTDRPTLIAIGTELNALALNEGRGNARADDAGG